MRDRLREQRLAGAGRPVEEEALRDARAEPREPLRVAEEVDDLLRARPSPPRRRRRPSNDDRRLRVRLDHLRLDPRHQLDRPPDQDDEKREEEDRQPGQAHPGRCRASARRGASAVPSAARGGRISTLRAWSCLFRPTGTRPASRSVWRVPYDERAAEADAWAREHGIPPATADGRRTCLLLVDVPEHVLHTGLRALRSGCARRQPAALRVRLPEPRLDHARSSRPSTRTARCRSSTPRGSSTGRTASRAVHGGLDRGRRGRPLAEPPIPAEQDSARASTCRSSRPRPVSADGLAVPRRCSAGSGTRSSPRSRRRCSSTAIARGAGRGSRSRGTTRGPSTTRRSARRSAARRNGALDRAPAGRSTRSSSPARRRATAWPGRSRTCSATSPPERIFLLEDCTSPVLVPGVVDFTAEADEAFARFAGRGVRVVRSTGWAPG